MPLGVLRGRGGRGEREMSNLGHAQIFDRGYLVSCSPRLLISMESRCLKHSVVSALFS